MFFFCLRCSEIVLHQNCFRQNHLLCTVEVGIDFTKWQNNKALHLFSLKHTGDACMRIAIKCRCALARVSVEKLVCANNTRWVSYYAAWSQPCRNHVWPCRGHIADKQSPGRRLQSCYNALYARGVGGQCAYILSQS